MIYIFYILAALLIWTSWLSLRGGIEYLRFFRLETADEPSAETRFTTLIVPCKGLDQGLEENLSAMCRMDHPGYEVLFAVDDRSDPAVAVIERITAANEHAKLVIASKAERSSQKIANLREAVRHASPRSEIFAFADSDARPDCNWLRCLTAPLGDVTVGGTTGYRWFISPRPSFASELRSVWNASVASTLGANTKNNFCWGGAMAMTRSTFEITRIDERWDGALSDDFAVTRAVNDAGLQIRFVPQAMTPSIETCTFAEMLEFTTRQMKITRVYHPRLWAISFIGSGHFCVVLAAAVSLAAFGRTDTVPFWAAVITLVTVAALSTAKAVLRLQAVKIALPQYERELKRQSRTQYTLWIITPAIFFYNCVAALLSRKIRWRGTVYKMVSPTETNNLDRT